MLSFPRKDSERLISFLCDAVSDQLWCKFDWTRLEIDEALKISWAELCETIKHHRRFFFAKPRTSLGDEDEDDQTFGPAALLAEISQQLTRSDVIRTVPAGSYVFRARPDDGKGPYVTAADLGFPPPEKALQTNRMNPVGIPMFYGADTHELAMDEVRDHDAYVGRFGLLRDARILDLSAIPHAPGPFSGVDRALRLGLVFLRAFERDIMQPVDRSTKAHVDYLPSQVVTEYFREFGVAGAAIDGVRYRSVVSSAGLNVVYFATQENIAGALPPAPYQRDIWLELIDCEHHRSKKPA